MRKWNEAYYPPLPPKTPENGRLSDEQVSATIDPAVPIRKLIGERFIGCPYHVWKTDLDLARAVNDALAQPSNSTDRSRPSTEARSHAPKRGSKSGARVFYGH